MSRGGFGRGRGGFSGAGRGGPFSNDDLKPDYSVTELFPPQAPPVQSALSKEERLMVARWRGQREKVHNGPMYTVMGRKRGMEDPFNDIARYSAKYRKVERRAPKLDARPYVAEFFPAELYATLGIDEKTASTKTKTLLISALDTLNPLDELADADEDAAAAAAEAGEKKDADAEDAAEEDEEEDHFSDDEDDDYNAERYFESEGEVEDYGDDGDDGGDYY
ncbi:DNA-directed RNA polymerase III, subunit Rpc31 [Sphaerosporella brunnea]|uniref:DNA-directed RNA polymerase III subunit n=1 Tax=Sphaerosporella brunnea TaxID=1250544 RepID=A0A5J5ESE1_9PEZI|nr:DNA-directed RNA polymerase III, subunit Rpc31 [Sphaerosporella brunnea]